MLELRDYQQECVNRVLNAFRENPHGECYVVLPCGCHKAGQGILMYDGSIKKVEDIVVGDLLMGPDSLPRRVLTLHHGQDDMVEIKPVKGQSWTVNKGHILTLTRMSQGSQYPSEQGGGMYDVSVNEWLQWTQNKKNIHKLFRVPVDFPLQGEQLPMHPYLLGVLLGDGGLTCAERVQFTNPDHELVEEVDRILTEKGLTLCPVNSKDRAQSYAIRGRVGSGRPKDSVQTIHRIMKSLGLLPIRCENRFVPHQFKTASRRDRLELLAGLLDTDGYMNHSGFEYVSKSHQLAQDVAFVARSLGLAAYISEKNIPEGIYYRISISGNCSIIPNRIERKKASERQQNKSVLRTGFTCELTGTKENYYGFTIDGDHRYLLDDFTVTHNSGKTIIFSTIIHTLAREHGLHALIIAHRDELLDQAAEKYRFIDPSAIIGKIGSGIHQYGAEVTVASIATISRPEHLRRLKETGYGIIIIDECHHSMSDGYQRVLEAMKESFVFGVTATPDRLDKKLLFNGKEPLFQLSIIDMIARGHLCDMRAIAIKTEISLDHVSNKMGDFNEKELDLAVNTPARNRRVVEAYQQHANGKRAICFAVTVDHAHALANAFNDHDIKAATITGNTPMSERKELYKQLRTGAIQVLTSVMVLSEGFDETSVECVIMARPTQSRSLYVQCIGRGIRLHPGKTECVILDLTDNCMKHRIAPINLKRAIQKEILDGETVKEALERRKKEDEEAASRRVTRKLRSKRLEDFQVDLLEKLEWQTQEQGHFVLELPRLKHRIAIIPIADTDLYFVAARLAPEFIAQKWCEPRSLEDCQDLAEERAMMLLNDPSSKKLVDKNAAWRNKPMTDNQKKMFKWYKIPIEFGMSAGQAADIIDVHKAEIEKKKAAKAARKVAREEVNA